ncbi:bacteriophage holin [Patescibacteria group bacterium]|nr:bacteriophage holin [Patescibacteria group bacterium]
MKLNVKAFALTGGILISTSAGILAIMAQYLNFGQEIVALIGTAYIGYVPGFVGAIIGAVWGFVDGLFGFALIAWLYNKLSETKKK